MTTRLRVLVADPLPLVGVALHVLMHETGDLAVVGCVKGGDDLLREHERLLPDLVVTDLTLAGTSGMVAIDRLLARRPRARILVFTELDGEEDIFQAVRRGVLGYLLKHAPPARVLEAVRSVGRGERHIDAALAAKLASRALAEGLSDREIEVLHELCRGRSNDEIARALAIANGTVRTHVSSIVWKLRARSRTDAVLIARERGLLRDWHRAS